MNTSQRPSVKELVILVVAIAVWMGVTATFLTLRPEHWFLGGLIAALFLINVSTRKLVVALIPFAIFGISYDWMNLCHNYEVNPVDIEGIYNAEKSFFGITTAAGEVLTPNEYFAQFHNSLIDVLCGVFYLCWVPVPIAFGLWLYYKKQRKVYLHFALVFLLVNLIGFAGYYIHPAAPPWYIAEYGFDLDLSAHGSVAGLGEFDKITGLSIFDGLYTRNANIFAAVPSLHSAYVPVAFYYSLKAKCPLWMRIALAVIACGIWFTAVYTSHHYLIDVILGIFTAALGIAIFEGLLMRIPPFKRFMDAYTAYVS